MRHVIPNLVDREREPDRRVRRERDELDARLAEVEAARQAPLVRLREADELGLLEEPVCVRVNARHQRPALRGRHLHVEQLRERDLQPAAHRS